MSDLSALNLEAGSLVGGYTLISRLGSGAMGSVWRVRDDGGHQYAMKILRDSLSDDDSPQQQRDELTARERLRREAMALQKVRHPGVCGIVDMELDDALAFIVTELIEGKNLREDVRVNGRYVSDDLERLARKLIEAVRAVHAAGIVHRDIKPTNVMVSSTGPVLVDFGIAMGEGESHVTRTGLVMGTPGFIAPEIIDGAESDEMTDWWSVASVLAFAATGEPVFGTKPMMTVLERAAAGSANLAGLPAGTMAAFRSALNPDRTKRCTPDDLLQAIAVDALNPQASMKIYAAKGRPSDNPLIVHIAEFDKLAPIVAEVPEKAKILAEKYWPGPLTMILPKSDLVPQETTGGLDSVAVRFPSDRIAQELIKAAGGYVAAPSANTSGRPSPTTAQHVEEDLGEAIEMIIDGGQVGIGLESTIVDFTEDVPVVLRPGYISLEMLQETLGDVRMDKGLIAADSKVRPKAPGMKYRHYAPKADLAIVEGPEEAVVKKINELAAEAKAHGEQVGIIATDETKDRYPEGLVVSIGSRKEEETIAHHLYEVLRDFDQSAVRSIYSEAFYTPRMGQAIMNRLLKAAGHKIIQVV
mgnify:CR=1 FL=1